MFRSLTIIALAGLASAQISGISSQCMNALTGIVANSDANACLNPTGLIPIATNNNTSIVGPISDWTKTVCSAAPCSNQTLSDVVNSLVTGCQSEIAGAGENIDPTTLASSLTPLVQQFYPTVRKVLCLEDGNTNCLAQTLGNIESVTGPLTLQNIMSLLGLGDGSTMETLGGNMPNLPSNITCTDCIKAAYNIINTDVPSIISDAAPALQSQCGSQFTDGSTPSGITDVASNSNTSSITQGNSNGNGAMPLVASGLGVVALTIISGAVTLF